MKIPALVKVIVFLCFAFVSARASAGEWGLGAAVAHYQSPLNGVENRIASLPYITYQGEHLNIDLTTISYSLFRDEKIQIALEGELRFEGYDPDDSPTLVGMEKRKHAFDAGISFARAGPWGELKFTFLSDITGTHKGYEARAQIQRPYLLNRWIFAPAVGIAWLDSAIVDYYYGVGSNEATDTRKHYVGRSTTNAFADFMVGYGFSDRLELLGGMKLILLGESIQDSPIVDKSYDAAVFSALKYKF